MTDNELMHYGVLGMKWGKRKARPANDVQRTRAAYKNISDGKDLYSKTNKYAAKESVGKAAVKNFLMGPAGKTTYDMARSMNHSRASSFARAMFDINVSQLTGVAASTAVNYGAQQATGKQNRIFGTAANYGAQYGVDRAYRNSGKMASLQQKRLLKEYQSRKRA